MKLSLIGFLQISALAWAGFIFWFSILRVVPAVYSNESALVLHFSSYLLLTFLAMHALEQKANAWLIAITVVCYGIALEILQNFVGRFMDIYDGIANTLGVLTAALIVQRTGGGLQKSYKS